MVLPAIGNRIINRKSQQRGVECRSDWQQASVLAIETSSNRCCVALRSGGATYLDDRDADRSHKELLLHMVSEQCAAAGITPQQLDALGCGAGPGSFTGVRIGVAATQALALAAQAPVVMVNSLDVLAAAVCEQTESAPESRLGGCICARRSRSSAYYFAYYPKLDAAAELVHSRSPMSLCESYPQFQSWLAAQNIGATMPPVVGECPDWLDVPARGAQIGLPADSVESTGRAVLALTIAGLMAHAGVTAAAAVPVYLPEDSPWRPQ